ncbi:hypothetical protein Agub_g8410 [Astrephomene gubernaculifera]|uniref:Uncharacterized protein n=1 Tax=Astrephomene gubernaculifera TaxID=47775 RepID=A0AAD3DRL8_9CHLO|nr:hypothetical protein Agub_g8410 [Astrephomene gubernaculifera]
MLGGGDAVVNSELVRGEVHHERRLHHLLLLEELKAWEQQYVATSITPTHGSATPVPGTATPTNNGAATPTHGTSYPSTQNGIAAATGTPASAPGLAAEGSSGPPVFSGFARSSFNAGTTVSLSNSCLPSRAPSPSPHFAASHGGLSHEGSGNMGNGIPGYTPAGFPQADEGGAACPQSASLVGGGEAGPDGLAAAPAGPFELGTAGGMGRCTSAEGALGGLGVGGNLNMMVVSEPLIDVGLDLPAAVQLQDHVAAAMERQRSTAPSDMGVVPPSPLMSSAATADGMVGGAHRSTSTGSVAGMVASRVGDPRTQPSTSGGGAPPLPAATGAARASIGRTMTVTGDEHETGQQPLAPAPTAVPPSLGNTDAAAGSGGGAAGSAAGTSGGSAPTTQDQLAQLRRSEVRIQHSALLNYWLVTIRCRDRNKLFFDTVCTLADMNYDIYHATIDSEGDAASQLFYVRPRYGECIWDERRAAKLRYMLESAVQRRFPRGTKVCVHSTDRSALVQLFSALSSGGFWITRADVRTHQDAAVFEFTITDTRGHLPEQAHVQRICEHVGGVMTHDVYGPSQGVQPGSGSRLGGAPGRGPAGAAGSGVGTFRFSILERRWNKGWQGGVQGGNAAGSYDSAVSSGSM